MANASSSESITLSDSSRICVVYTPPASPAMRASSASSFDVGGGAGRVEHAGAQARRARVHAFAQQLDHPRLLGRRRGTVWIVHRRYAQRRMADQRRDVDRGPRLVPTAATYAAIVG